MDWFERLTGFKETGYDETRSRLAVEGGRLRSEANGRDYAIGDLELASLGQLRQRVEGGTGAAGRLRVQIVRGDVRAMHRESANAGALFQVASQFNLLEMVSPSVTPEDGVTRYQHDRTQGPACAMAAGASTIYRNYFALVGDARGQTRDRQLDGLGDIGKALSAATSRPVAELWTMCNGYALCSQDGLDAINTHLADLGDEQVDKLLGLLRIGLHRDVEVTDGDGPPHPLVSQAFCSALPVAYSKVPARLWQPFAQLVLEAAYEATLCAAVLNARRGASKTVLLTRLGGGAFGNDDRWIDEAMQRALAKAAEHGLDVRLVSYSAPSRSMLEMAEAYP